MALTETYDGSIVAILEEIRATANLEGLAVVDLAPGPHDEPVLYNVGVAGAATIVTGRLLIAGQSGRPTYLVGSDRRPLLACPWMMSPSRPGGLLMWRAPDGAAWSRGDLGMAASVAVLLRMMIGSAAGQIGIDRLTGLPNRRWFLDEADRRADRLDHDGAVASLTLIDVDDLHRINATLGREHGDRVLIRLAGQLRSIVRPGDLVARVGTDEFAIWQDGMDHLTAAERADALCTGPLERDSLDGPRITLSIGIVSRSATQTGDAQTGNAQAEDVRGLLRRAYMAAREVRTRGGGGWRVSHPDPLPGCSDPAG
ncbi:MAG TPA: GGDEF domain-containing protein [Rhodopila sp.]|nr:GGDEF domain-containing protein [Rhodopila sp.]